MSEPTIRAPDLPEIVGGKYLIGKCVGSGSSGSVHLVRNRDTGEQLAIKMRRARPKEEPVRFLAEARDMSRMRHPRIVPVLDMGKEGQLYWYVMPYYANGSLREIVGKNQSIEPFRALDWIVQMCEGLDYLHGAGLVHRDVKPHNVLLDEHMGAMLTDFGLVRHLRGGVPYRTRTDQSMGTPNYRAPEQAVDAAAADVRADVYGVGATLYFLLTGRRPGFLYMVKPDDPAMDAVPPKLRGFILGAMAYDPKDRPPSARDMAFAAADLANHYVPSGSVSVSASWKARFQRGRRQGWLARLKRWLRIP